MTISSTSLYGSSTSKGYTGLASGLDTDELVKQMTSGTRNKINRQYQAKQKLLYRQAAYREISTKLLAFSSKYLSYSSGSTSNILNSAFFKADTIKSSSDYIKVSGDTNSIKNFSITDVKSVATVASFTSSKTVTDGTFSSDELKTYTSSLAGETMTIAYDGKTYDIKIDRDFGRGDAEVTLQNVANELNEQLAKIKDKDGKLINGDNSLLKYEVVKDSSNNETGIKIITADTAKKATLTAASNSILSDLKMETGEEASSNENIDISKLSIKGEDILKDTNQYMTFDLNGITKQVKLTDKNGNPLAETKDDLKAHLQSELDKAYGSGKVNVNYEDGKLTFKAEKDNDLFGVSGISKNLRNYIGIEPTTYNRVNRTSAITDAGIDGLENVDTYKITINGHEREFKNTMSFNEIVKSINDDTELGIEIYYSSTTNKFTVKSDETGAHQQVNISDVEGGGNLAEKLFGKEVNSLLGAGEYLEYDKENDRFNIMKAEYNDETNETTVSKIGTAAYDDKTQEYTLKYDGKPDDIVIKGAYHIKSGTDTEITYKLNGVTTTITRSTADFSVDGINVSLSEKAAGAATKEKPVTFDVTSNPDDVLERIKEFVKDYNEIISLITTKTKEKPSSGYDPLTPEQREEMKEDEIKNWEIEAKKGAVFGDTKLNNALYSLRGAMTGKTSVSSLTLADIGIKPAAYDTEGKLTIDESKLKTMLAQNADEIVSLFSGAASDANGKSGVAVQLQEILKANVGTAGISGLLIDEAGLDNSMTSDSNFLSQRMKEYDDNMKVLKNKLAKERERYYNKFTALEKALSNLNTQSTWFTDMMGS